jgi:hypothetical protein
MICMSRQRFGHAALQSLDGLSPDRRQALQDMPPYHESVWGMSHSAQRGGMAIRR